MSPTLERRLWRVAVIIAAIAVIIAGSVFIDRNFGSLFNAFPIH